MDMFVTTNWFKVRNHNREDNVDYKLYDGSFIPQLSRILGSASDDKAAYVISLNAGKTEQDLLTCLNFRPSGSGYYFDVTRLTSDIGTLLGTGNDCVRTIVHDILSFSKCNITCNVVGTPTHVILGGIAPFVFEIGKDVKLLSATTGTSVDKTGIGSVVSVAAFKLKFTQLDFLNLTTFNIGSISFRSGYGDPRFKDFDDYQKQLVRQIGTGNFRVDFTVPSMSMSGRNGLWGFTSEIGSNNIPVDGISVRMAYNNSITGQQYIYLERAGTNPDEIYVSRSAVYTGTTLSVRRVNGITKLYSNDVEVQLFKSTDTAQTTPVQFNLAYDLSTAVICRLGRFDWVSPDSSSNYAVNNMVVTKL